METRKIQLVGGTTYTVSLPKEWADAQGLTTGDAVELHEYIDGMLAVQAPECERTAPEQITVHVSQEVTAGLEHLVRAAYAAGTKTLQFENPEGFSAEQHRSLSRVTRTLTGASVAEDAETTLTVKIVLDTGELSVQQSVRQLRFVVLEMHRDATDALTEREPAQLSRRDEQVARVHAMSSRALSRGLRRLDEVDTLGVTRPELFELWATTRELKRVGDHAEQIATAAGRLDGVDQELVAETQAAAERSRELLSDAVGVVIDDGSTETAQQVLAEREQIHDHLSGFEDHEASAEEWLRLEPVRGGVRRTAAHAGNIAELGLEQAIRDGELHRASTQQLS